MPKLNGYDLAQALRQVPALAGSVLVAVTGWGQEDDRQARDAGFDHHLVKPVDPDDIVAILRGLPQADQRPEDRGDRACSLRISASMTSSPSSDFSRCLRSERARSLRASDE